MASKPALRRFELPVLGRPWIAALIAVLLPLVGLSLAYFNERSNAAEQTRRAVVQAQILGGSVSAALAFDDRNTALEYINALHVNREIEAAGIYDSSGGLVAGYSTDEEGLPAAAALPDRPLIRAGRLRVATPVTQGGLRLGTVYLRYLVEPLSRRITRYVGISVILTMAAMLIAVLGSSYAAATQSFRELKQESEARERAETALRQAQKMEAMGQLTGGVAHDFNNLLMAASSGVELLERTEDPERRKRLLSGVRDALDRGAKLTQQLLAFARRTAVKPEVIDVRGRLEGIRELLDRSLREDVRVEFRVEPGVWPIEVDPGQFDIAIVNIAVNARDAMPRGGPIRIEAANVEGGLDDDDAVRISVTDQGEGMPSETAEKAFEPFFTTKGVGRGTGLGLSQVYGFARAAGGYASIDSAIGRGTTVSLTLPRSRNAVAGQAQPIQKGIPEIGASNLLVVEDDEQIADILLQMLDELGCKSTRVSTAAEGLKLFGKGKFEGVISDMVMPGKVTGLELVREIRKRSPKTPLLLMTGYSSAASEARQEGFVLLEKPFNLERLARALGQVFGPGRSGDS